MHGCARCFVEYDATVDLGLLKHVVAAEPIWADWRRATFVLGLLAKKMEAWRNTGCISSIKCHQV